MKRSLSEIARLVQKSERTIRRWIADGAMTVTALENGMYEVSEDEILRLRPQGEYTTIMRELAAMSARLAQMEEKLDRLLLASSTRVGLGLVDQPRQPRPQIATSDQAGAELAAELPGMPAWVTPRKETPVDLPADAIHLADLAAELGIKRSTLTGHVLKESNGLAHIAVQNPHGGGYARYFTPDQAARVRAWHLANTKKH